jgi:SET domain-containing protein
MVYLYSGNGSLFLTQGHAGLINSSNFPNSKIEIDIENNIITIIAIRDIFINEEITLKYL